MQSMGVSLAVLWVGGCMQSMGVSLAVLWVSGCMQSMGVSLAMLCGWAGACRAWV